MLDFGKILRDQTRRSKHMVRAARLNTERKRSEEVVPDSDYLPLRIMDSVPTMIWMSGRNKVWEYVNKAWLDFTGRTLEGQIRDGWAVGVHPDDVAFCLHTYGSNFERHLPFQMDYRLRRADGEYRWMTDTGAPRMARDGTFLGYIGNAVDITERRQGECRLHQSELRFQAMADSVSEMVFVALADGRWVYLNSRFRDYTGLAVSAATRLGWLEPVHPEDRDHFLARAERRTLTEEECRLRGADGTYREFVVRLQPMLDAESRTLRWFGICGESDGVKQPQKGPHRLTGKLLLAQDEERRRIARELHDSAAQNLAGASLALERVSRSIPASSADVGSALQESRDLIDQSQREIRTISYLLHPPMLDEAGLPSALRWYAEGCSKRNGVTFNVVVGPELLGRRLPQAVETTLFRVAQEAMTNSNRHAHSKSVWIRLTLDRMRSAFGCAVLEVADDGQGLPDGWATSSLRGETQRQATPSGLGLASMRERMHQLGGRLELSSGTNGTIVRATAPIEESKVVDPESHRIATARHFE
jgi:PAS domain S-box-containing protein